MSRPTRPTYKTGSRPTYNKALRRRGSLTIWFDPAPTWEAVPTGKRGRQHDYSDAAIQTCLTMKVMFGMALRQTAGFVESLLRLIGLNWAVPDFSTLSRRCLIPWFSGAILSLEWKDALWDKFVTAAPRHARRQSSNNEGLPAIGSRAGPNNRKLRPRS